MLMSCRGRAGWPAGGLSGATGTMWLAGTCNLPACTPRPARRCVPALQRTSVPLATPWILPSRLVRGTAGPGRVQAGWRGSARGTPAWRQGNATSAFAAAHRRCRRGWRACTGSPSGRPAGGKYSTGERERCRLFASARSGEAGGGAGCAARVIPRTQPVPRGSLARPAQAGPPGRRARCPRLARPPAWAGLAPGHQGWPRQRAGRLPEAGASPQQAPGAAGLQ